MALIRLCRTRVSGLPRETSDARGPSGDYTYVPCEFGKACCFDIIFDLYVALGVCAQDKPVHTNRAGGVAASGTTLRAIVASGALESLNWPNFSAYRTPMATLYQRSNYAPVWIRNGSPTPQALEMISIPTGG